MVKAIPITIRILLVLATIALCVNAVTSQAFAAEVDALPVAVEDEIEYYDLNPGTELAVEGGQEVSPLEAASNEASEFLHLIFPFVAILLLVVLLIALVLVVAASIVDLVSYLREVRVKRNKNHLE